MVQIHSKPEKEIEIKEYEQAKIYCLIFLSSLIFFYFLLFSSFFFFF